MRFALLFLSEYANMFAVSADRRDALPRRVEQPVRGLPLGARLGRVLVPGKGMVFIFVQMWLRWTLPRLRVDQLMYVGWKVLIPFSFVLIIGIGLWVHAGGVGDDETDMET